ncbi:MAG: 50S ribosomal protein L19e [Candidatus Bathyarchaeia archaeon]
MSLKNQRRLASKILKVGESRVRFNPERLEDLEGVITREEIRRLIREGTIKVAPAIGVSRARARLLMKKRRTGRRRGPGSRGGKAGARQPPKQIWKTRIRLIRRHLRTLRERRIIQKSAYRRLYLLAKGGTFLDRSHVDQYIQAHGLSRRR